MRRSDQNQIPGRAATRTSSRKNGVLSALPQAQPLTRQVADRISTAIGRGTLAAGERLVEATLASMLGVSRAPIREALRILEAEGLVKTTAGRGTYVIKPSPADVEQMMVLRAVLEGLAARLIAADAQPEVLTKFKSKHRQLKASAKAKVPAAWRDLDRQFHEELCVASGNRFLLESWRLIGNLLRVYLHNYRPFEHDPNSVLANHQRLLDLLTGGDPQLAEQETRRILIETGYKSLGKPVPPALSGYVGQTATPPGRKKRTTVDATVSP